MTNNNLLTYIYQLLQLNTLTKESLKRWYNLLRDGIIITDIDSDNEFAPVKYVIPYNDGNDFYTAIDDFDAMSFIAKHKVSMNVHNNQYNYLLSKIKNKLKN